MLTFAKGVVIGTGVAELQAIAHVFIIGLQLRRAASTPQGET
ncbi:MAG: hypothetical protein JWP75_2084 [Frondihabitans sp.]|nr:hypothetical protein [Frondihabitans sp.]